MDHRERVAWHERAAAEASAAARAAANANNKVAKRREERKARIKQSNLLQIFIRMKSNIMMRYLSWNL